MIEVPGNMLSIALKLSSPIFILIGCIHLVLGVSAEILLGAQLEPATLSDPVLDSQNRFYGVAFSLYGFLMYLCASDLEKYQVVLRLLIWVFFAAGLARLVSIGVYGLPPVSVLILLGLELLLPPVLHVWLARSLH